MTACPHHLNDGPLACDNPSPHEPGHGCTYTATAGADLSGERADE